MFKVNLSSPSLKKVILPIIGVCIFFTILPYFHLYWLLGQQAPQLPVAAYGDGNYYFDRMEEVRDGYPFIGNPYFIEHRSELSPAFFLPDWLAAIPLVFGAPLILSVSIDLFIWSFFFVLFAYLLFRLLSVPERFALWGGVFVYAEVYLLMLRPVSMQVVFPFFLFFLLMYLYWLHEPAEKKRIFFVAFSAALCGYIYTYAWQIVVVVLLSTPIIFFLLKKRAEIYSFCYVFGLFIIGILPLLLYTAKQIQHPLYFETMRRIGLINTHIPIFAAVTTCMWVVLMGMFWLVLRRQNKEISIIGSNGTPFFFFVITGFAMIVVALSNIITGKDLELPQHIERFTILWLGLASTYSLYFFRSNFNVCKSSLRYLLLLFVFVALFIFGNARYLNMYGPVGIFTSSYDSSRLRDVQDIVKPLNWLKNNVETPSVIWADPNGAVNQYITMMTPHYVLYSAGGELQLVSDKELEERYLVTHYFALTEADLENDYVAYGGAGNAFHQWKTVNRKVRLCKMLHFDHFGYDCGQLVDLISWKGKSYFEGLYKKYLAEVQPNINVELKKYHVTYIIHDAVTDTRVFNPQQITGTKLVYDDGRFSIYSF